MKKPIITLALAAFFIPATIITGCKSPTQKAEDAKENVQDAREDLNEAKQDANTAVVKAASDEEWKAFKIDADAKIKKNELRISQLRAKSKDQTTKQKIDALETRNDELKSRLNDYERNKTDWATFTRDYNQSLSEVDNSFNEFPEK